MTISLAVFDMAGTTIDDGAAVYRALQLAVEETGATVAPHDLQAWMGTEKRAAITALIELGGGDPAAVDGAGDGIVDRAFVRFQEILGELYRAQPPVAIAGVPEAIASLRGAGVRVALTTGFSREIATGILDRLGWEVGGDIGAGSSASGTVRIDALVCGDEVAAGRPAPYMIHRAMERTGVLDVAEVAVAGDTLVDVQAGANSGAALVYGVLTGELDREAFAGQRCTGVLDSVTDIPALLAAHDA